MKVYLILWNRKVKGKTVCTIDSEILEFVSSIFFEFIEKGITNQFGEIKGIKEHAYSFIKIIT